MAKSKNIFFCQECGYESAKWLGQCPACKAWNTFVEEPTIGKGSTASGGIRHQAKASEPVLLSSEAQLSLFSAVSLLLSLTTALLPVSIEERTPS